MFVVVLFGGCCLVGLGFFVSGFWLVCFILRENSPKNRTCWF